MSPGASCDSILEQLSDYAEGELGESDARTVESHLAGCPPCRGELTLMRALVSGLHRIPEETAPPAILAAIQRRLPQKSGVSPAAASLARPPAPSPNLRPWRIASALAAALGALALVLVVPWVRQPASVARAPLPDAASIAQLSVTGGGVSVDGQPIAAGTAGLREGARVELSGQAREAGVQLAYADGSTVAVSGGSRLVVGAEELKLDSGDLELAVEKQKLHFRVRTPEAVVTVWGTKYRVSHHTVTSVEVQEGKVQVEAARPGGASTMLTAGQRVEVDAGRLSTSAGASYPEPAHSEDTRLPLGDDR